MNGNLLTKHNNEEIFQNNKTKQGKISLTLRHKC